MSAAPPVRRNARCPCGSGRRYKHCCGRGSEPVAPQADPGPLVVERFLDADTCRRLRTLAERLPTEEGTVRVLDTGTEAGYQDRRSTERVATLAKTHGAAGEFWPPVARALAEHIGPRYGLRIAWYEWPDVLDYGPGGHFSCHNDCELWDERAGRWRRTEDRDVSLLVYLNDDFEGGGLAFPELGREIRPTAGMLVAFPSDHRYAHHARPVIAGRRQVIVSWGAARGTPKLSEAPRLGVVYTSPDLVPAGLPLVEVPEAGWYIDPAIKPGWSGGDRVTGSA